MEFKKAEKKQAKLRLAITGPSGSGKTFSGLLIASGLGSKIALIDTENHSAATYADDVAFDTLALDPPYTIEKYLNAMRLAHEANYDVLVIDSITHAWAGEGGLLSKKEGLDQRGGNSYTNWASITKEHEKFKAALLHYPLHLIATMRSKQDYVLEANDKGKMAPKKVGLAPIQREGMEYEFSIVIDMAMDHNASVSKTRIRAFDGKLFTPTKATGIELLQWLATGVAISTNTVNGQQESEEKPPVPAIDKIKLFEQIEKIKERLAAHYGGDLERMNAGLILLTEHKDRATNGTAFLELQDLDHIGDSHPAWVPAILAKMDKEGIGQ